jgi:cyanate permease
VFAANGLVFASVFARTPSIRDTLGLDSAQLGLLILCLSAGAVAGLPLSGPIVHRLGAARALFSAGMSMTFGLMLLVTGLATGAVVAAAVAFFSLGLGTGIWDVSMNVEGADVERRLGANLMPRLHGVYSLGTVAGAGLGAAAAAAGVPLAVQTSVFVIALPLVAGLATRRFLPVHEAIEEKAGSGVLAAWREPRTLIVGLLVLGFAFSEGSANDWIAVALVDGYTQSEAVGAVAFGFFVAAMTAGRMFGGSTITRFGRVVVLRALALIGMTGLALVLFSGLTPLAFLGALLWGVGSSLGFPIGMSAAADEPARAAARVSVVSSIGYTAFLAGPPLIGQLTQRSGILHGLLVVFVALALGLLASGASRAPAEVELERAA